MSIVLIVGSFISEERSFYQYCVPCVRVCFVCFVFGLAHRGVSIFGGTAGFRVVLCVVTNDLRE